MENRILGIDFGEKRSGFAISDPLHIIATPHSIMRNLSIRELGSYINTIIDEYNIKKIVIGYPLLMSGEEGRQAKEVKSLVDCLKKEITRVDFILWDERLSTKGVQKLFQDKTKNRKKKKRVDIDDSAACLILQSYLDSCRK